MIKEILTIRGRWYDEKEKEKRGCAEMFFHLTVFLMKLGVFLIIIGDNRFGLFLFSGFRSTVYLIETEVKFDIYVF